MSLQAKLSRILLITGIVSLAACSPVAPAGKTLSITENSPWEQWAKSYPTWVESVEPYNIVSNIYYVGSKGLGSYLLTSADGHILIDGGLPQNSEMIIASISALGFDIGDVKILLNSHAHMDHSGGLANLKTSSGAQLIASEGDRSALEGGFYLGFEDQKQYAAPPVKVDRIVADKEQVTLGSTIITAQHTPGHTKGCTSWTTSVSSGAEEYQVLFFCSASVAGNKLIPEQYQGIIQDYRDTFDTTRTWTPDISLSNHPGLFGQNKKYLRKLDGDPNAFVDRNEFHTTILKLEQRFSERLHQARIDANLTTGISQFSFDNENIQTEKNYLFFLHNISLENDGFPSTHDRFGENQYWDILNKLQTGNTVVVSELRPTGADVEEYAQHVLDQVNQLINYGVPANQIKIVGASKGAYIATLVSHRAKNSDLKFVLAAGCSTGVVDYMLDNNIHLYGDVLTIRDKSDELAGSCENIFQSSNFLGQNDELILELDLGHGLIFKSLNEWITPAIRWPEL